jgi:hypothetical protein
MGRYLLAAEALATMQGLKDKTVSDTAWARSSTGLLVGEIASTVNTATHVIRDAIKVLPLSTGATAAEEVGLCLLSSDEEAAIRGELPSGSVVTNAAEKCLQKAIKRQLQRLGYGWVNQVNDTITALDGHITDLRRAVRMPQEQEALRRTVTEQVLRLDGLIGSYQKEMREATDRAEDLNQFKERVDTACAGSRTDRLMVGRWRGQSDSIYDNPQGQTLRGPCHLEIERRIGPNRYAGTKTCHFTRTASPGRSFSDGRRSHTFDEVVPIDIEVSGAIVVIQEKNATVSEPPSAGAISCGSNPRYVMQLVGRTLSQSSRRDCGPGGFLSISFTK